MTRRVKKGKETAKPVSSSADDGDDGDGADPDAGGGGSGAHAAAAAGSGGVRFTGIHWTYKLTHISDYEY